MSMKEDGIPFGARMLFRIRHVPTLIWAFSTLLMIGMLVLVSVFKPSSYQLLVKLEDLIDEKLQKVLEDREKLRKLYS